MIKDKMVQELMTTSVYYVYHKVEVIIQQEVPEALKRKFIKYGIGKNEDVELWTLKDESVETLLFAEEY